MLTVVTLMLAAVGVVAVALAVGDDGAGEVAGASPPDRDPESEPEPDPSRPPSDEPDHLEEPEVSGDEAGEAEPTQSGETGDRGRLVIHHVGDVNLDHDHVPIFGQGGPEAAWDGARDTFVAADLVMANLECAASAAGIPQDKQFVFRCDLGSLPAMRAAGVDAVTLANNHSGDLGVPAMVDSVTNVEAAGMVAIGVGVDEQDAYRSRIVEVAGWRVALLGFGGVVPVAEWTARGDLPGQATGYDPVRMAQAVADARDGADLVVASVHWGDEGALEPRPEDVIKARALAEAGADVVFGHHAHRLQSVEQVDGAPVFWNLGNFVWPRLSAQGAATAVAEWIVEPDGHVSACLIPFEIDTHGVPAPTGAPRTCA